jgi:signal transduction histidine kinase
MKRFFQSMRFQLTTVLVLFVVLTMVFVTSVVINSVRNEIFSVETKRIEVVADQLVDKYQKLYEGNALQWDFGHLTLEKQKFYLQKFLKPTYDEYFQNLKKSFPELEIGYYIPPISDKIVYAGNPKYKLSKKLTVIKPIYTKKMQKGYVFVDEPYPIIMKPVNEIREESNRVTVYSALLAALFVLIVTSIFTFKIVKIKKGLKILEKDLDYRLPKFSGEIGDIAISINAMAESLKKNIEESQRNEALRTLGMFTAGVVHEVRNPLTSIKGFAQILEKKLNGKSEEKYIKPILRETDRLSRIVKDLLNYGKPTPLQKTEFNINKFFEIVTGLAKQFSTNKKIHFNINCEDINIKADEKKCEELFLNLLINSIQAIKNEGEIAISCKKEKDFAKIIVSDNGCGMDKNQLEHIFVPFYTTKAEGTGLGLAIAYRIVKEHGGNIEVKSEKGKGTTFIIYLPV